VFNLDLFRSNVSDPHCDLDGVATPSSQLTRRVVLHHNEWGGWLRDAISCIGSSAERGARYQQHCKNGVATFSRRIELLVHDWDEAGALRQRWRRQRLLLCAIVERELCVTPTFTSGEPLIKGQR
jgi:hypothetical protein